MQSWFMTLTYLHIFIKDNFEFFEEMSNPKWWEANCWWLWDLGITQLQFYQHCVNEFQSLEPQIKPKLFVQPIHHLKSFFEFLWIINQVVTPAKRQVFPIQIDLLPDDMKKRAVISTWMNPGSYRAFFPYWLFTDRIACIIGRKTKKADTWL